MVVVGLVAKMNLKIVEGDSMKVKTKGCGSRELDEQEKLLITNQLKPYHTGRWEQGGMK